MKIAATQCAVIGCIAQLMSRQEAAKHLGISLATLDELTHSLPCKLPYYLIGTIVKYDRRDLDRLIAK